MEKIKKREEIFIKNEEFDEQDRIMFEQVLASNISGNERTFFEQMKAKEEGEFAPAADLLLNERDNADEIYIVRYYFDEYKIGRGKLENRMPVDIYNLNLKDTLESDLFPLLGKHITLLDWLRANDFQGIDYNGNCELED